MPKPFSIKFLVDESVEYGIVLFLRDQGFDVNAVTEDNPSIPDTEVLDDAYKQKRILITNDKGFSRLVFKEKHKSHGVILVRLPSASTEEKILRLDKIIKSKDKDLTKVLTTITEQQTRHKLLPE